MDKPITDAQTGANGADALFLETARGRERAALRLAGTVTVVYFGFILVMAFRPVWLAAFLGAGSRIAAGMVGAFLMVLGACAVMGAYVCWRGSRHAG